MLTSVGILRPPNIIEFNIISLQIKIQVNLFLLIGLFLNSLDNLFYIKYWYLLFSYSVLSDSLRPHGVSMTSFRVLHSLSEFAQTHYH